MERLNCACLNFDNFRTNHSFLFKNDCNSTGNVIYYISGNISYRLMYNIIQIMLLFALREGISVNNNEFLNSVSTISSAINAYELLYDDVNDRNLLEQEAINIMTLICDTVSQGAKDCVSNEKSIELSALGYCCLPLPVSKALSNVLTDRLPKFISNQQIEIPIKIDYNNCFSMVLEINDNIDAASVLAQYILLSSLQVKQGLNFRCVDMVKGGSFFSVLHNLISKFPNKSGGRVFKSSMELDDLLKELDTTATKTIASLGNTFDSVYSYNQTNQVKLQEYVNVLYVNLSNRSDEEIKRIKVLLENRKKNGMSFILIGDCTSAGQFFEFSDYYKFADSII